MRINLIEKLNSVKFSLSDSCTLIGKNRVSYQSNGATHEADMDMPNDGANRVIFRNCGGLLMVKVLHECLYSQLCCNFSQMLRDETVHVSILYVFVVEFVSVEFQNLHHSFVC